MITKKNRLSEEIKKGSIYLSAGLFIIIVSCSILYIFNLGGSSQMGYSFTMKEQQQNDLKNENENLKLKVLKASSFTNITESLTVRTMTPANPEFFETRMDRLSKK